MNKIITLIKDGLVVDVDSLKKSHINGWVAIHNKDGDVMGGFSGLDKKLKVIDKYKHNDSIYLLYSIMDREVKQWIFIFYKIILIFATTGTLHQALKVWKILVIIWKINIKKNNGGFTMKSNEYYTIKQTQDLINNNKGKDIFYHYDLMGVATLHATKKGIKLIDIMDNVFYLYDYSFFKDAIKIEG